MWPSLFYEFVEELQAIHWKIYNHLFASAYKNNNNNDNNKVSAYKKRRHVEFEAGDLFWAILTKDGFHFSLNTTDRIAARKIGPLKIRQKKL